LVVIVVMVVASRLAPSARIPIGAVVLVSPMIAVADPDRNECYFDRNPWCVPIVGVKPDPATLAPVIPVDVINCELGVLDDP
jgi:hypothetical protein